MNMKYAALILAYKEAGMVNKLLDQLLHEFGQDIKIFIHVSRGSESMIDELMTHSQIEILPEHLGVDPQTLSANKKRIGLWASEILLSKMMYLFNYASANCDAEYYIVLSGQDLIVRKGIKAFFENHSSTIFMDGGLQNANQGARLLYKWPTVFKTKIQNKLHPIRVLRRLLLILYSTGIRINRQKGSQLFDGMDLYKNFYWMALPVECVRYFIEYEKNNPEIMDVYRKSICPEESFFSTVLANDDRFHEMFNWISGTNDYKGVTFFKNFTTAFSMLELSDIAAIEESGCYFAKKFSISYNSSLVEYFYKKVMEA